MTDLLNNLIALIYSRQIKILERLCFIQWRRESYMKYKLDILHELEKLSKKSIFTILQNTFMSFSGMLLVSSVITLFIKFPGINWNNILGEDVVLTILKLSSIGFDYISLFVIITFTYYYMENYNSKKEEKINHIPIIILNMALFLTVNYAPLSVLKEYSGSVFNTTYLGATGVFGAIIVCAITIKIYIFFVTHKIYIRLPKEVPSIVSDSFLSTIPMLSCVLFWWFVSFLLGFDILGFISQLLNPVVKLGDSILSVILIPFLNRILWFVGIHGAAVMNSLISPFMTFMDTSNLEAFTNDGVIQYIASGNFYSNYVWIGSFPISLALMSVRNKKIRSIGVASIVPTLFNIDEPIFFGLPIILNPILIIPFVLSGIVPSILSYIAINLNLISIPVLSMPWTIPAPIKAFLATNNDIRSFLWVLFLWLIIYLIFLPFIKKLSKESMEVSN